jgi:hypothetical protein
MVAEPSDIDREVLKLSEVGVGAEDADPGGQQLVAAADTLHRSLEVVLRQRITFEGETPAAVRAARHREAEVHDVAAVRAGSVSKGRQGAREGQGGPPSPAGDRRLHRRRG